MVGGYNIQFNTVVGGYNCQLSSLFNDVVVFH